MQMRHHGRQKTPNKEDKQEAKGGKLAIFTPRKGRKRVRIGREMGHGTCWSEMWARERKRSIRYITGSKTKWMKSLE